MDDALNRPLWVFGVHARARAPSVARNLEVRVPLFNWQARELAGREFDMTWIAETSLDEVPREPGARDRRSPAVHSRPAR